MSNRYCFLFSSASTIEKQDHHRDKQVDLKVYVYQACAAAEGSRGARKESRRDKQAA